ncbi:MAG TPA: SpoIID/LytB domain-containing protein [Pyrinomonadaceae bacterium]|jgi:stage II sporulation protein D|nr:SpoIID/LytB domain-containing protein [Pyrinomonadaceae bacterium]
MPNFLARSTVGLLLALQVFSPSLVCAQQGGSQQQSRPSDQDGARSPKDSPQKPAGEWQIGESLTIFDQPNSDSPAKGSPYKQEPIIRVALATDVRAATVSTTGHLMNASDDGPQLVAMDVTRVRLEPRLLSPLPAADYADAFRVQIAGLSAREEAEQKVKEVQEASGEDSQVVFDPDAKTWGLIVGARRPQVEAEELRARLETAGMEATITPASSANQTSTARPAIAGGQTIPASGTTQFPALAKSDSSPNSSTRNVRPTARFSLPTREVVASVPGARRLFSSSAPVVFASDSEATPVRFDDRPYRGRIEVFTNTRGALTVVNVLGLEDYVKGVVPNELSAGGYPLLEAHKAQAIAARTYALRNRGQFMSQGYDLLPTTRSQVYRGLVSENSLSSRAVDETRGIIATYNGEPINALYTSTCGGRTEDAGNIFNNAVPYLRGRECAAEGRAALANFIVKTNRDPGEFKEENVPVTRDVALLGVQGFTSLRKISDSWLKDDAELDEVRAWLVTVARLTHQVAPAVTEDVIRPPAFATALSAAVFGESRGGTLLDNADVEYFLAVRDANEIPAANRADVAMLIRDGYLAVLPDATLHPREPLSHARALHTIARILEARNLLQLQKGTARPTSDDSLVLRSTKGKDQPVKVSEEAFLFRQIGESVYPVRSVALVGGEPVVFHVNAGGEVDFLEVRPAPNGASADRFSPFTNWTTELSLGQAQGRLGRFASGIGSLVDLRVVTRGRSRRAIDLELVGTNGTRHVLGGRIRSALGLREQLFVIERKYDDDWRVTGFTFLGRGWGHGVGMCQVGAYGLAKQGFTYDQILKAYYSGIELTRMY